MQSTNEEPGVSNPLVRLGTTATTVDSGLLTELQPAFEAETGYRLEVYSTGTGKALALAREGQCDVLLIHARQEEDRFVTEGYGMNRRDVMYNEFVLLGPPGDPANISGETDIVVALRRIAESGAPFISRGDNSGTHMRELSLWELCGVEPGGNWYVANGSGMLDTLKKASDRHAYVLTDQSTYLFNQNDLNLKIVVEGDKRLFNPYGIIAVNPTKFEDLNFDGAMEFIRFVTDGKGSGIIQRYGMDRFGRPLFKTLSQGSVGNGVSR